MATLNQNYLTLAELASKYYASDGSILPIAEILAQSTPMMKDMNFIQGNLLTGFKCALRTELPASTFVKYYEGLTPTKGKRQTLTFGTARQRQLAQFDADLLDLNDNKSIALMDESIAHIMGMGQDWESEIIYGTAAEPEKIVGLAATYDTISTDETNIGFNVISGGGSGSDNTSIWIIWWGPGNIHGIYPKGSKVGIQKKVFPSQMVDAPDGGRYEAIEVLFKFDGGLAIPNWQSAVRIANIDASELADAGESGFNGAPLINLLITALNKFKPQVKMGKPYIYANRTVVTALDQLMTAKSTLGLSVIKGAEGEPVTAFRQIPVRLAERILDTEAVVS